MILVTFLKMQIVTRRKMTLQLVVRIRRESDRVSSSVLSSVQKAI
jgi:hypothetical protein